METEDPFSATLTLTNILVNPPDTSVITGLAVLVLLLVCSAFISGSEVAFFSLSPADRNNLKSKRSKRASGADSLLEKPERLLSTILIANNFVNVGIIMLAAYISNLTFEFTSNPILGFLLEVVIITFILLLFGEILPKVYATRHNLGFALVMALPLTICEKLFRPLSAILEKSSSLVQRRAGQIDHSISKGELSEAISLASGEDKEEEKILKQKEKKALEEKEKKQEKTGKKSSKLGILNK